MQNELYMKEEPWSDVAGRMLPRAGNDRLDPLPYHATLSPHQSQSLLLEAALRVQLYLQVLRSCCFNSSRSVMIQRSPKWAITFFLARRRASPLQTSKAHSMVGHHQRVALVMHEVFPDFRSFGFSENVMSNSGGSRDIGQRK